MFIQEMVPHHEDAIAMAESALTHAERPEIRRLAEDIRRTQTDENRRMRRWYREWFGRSVPPASGMMSGGMRDVEATRAGAGLRQGVHRGDDPAPPHGREDGGCSRGGTRREEMRTLADAIVRTQSAEIDQMNEWYRAWYGD